MISGPLNIYLETEVNKCNLSPQNVRIRNISLHGIKRSKIHGFACWLTWQHHLLFSWSSMFLQLSYWSSWTYITWISNFLLTFTTWILWFFRIVKCRHSKHVYAKVSWHLNLISQACCLYLNNKYNIKNKFTYCI